MGNLEMYIAWAKSKKMTFRDFFVFRCNENADNFYISYGLTEEERETVGVGWFKSKKEAREFARKKWKGTPSYKPVYYCCYKDWPDGSVTHGVKFLESPYDYEEALADIKFGRGGSITNDRFRINDWVND